MGEGEADWHRAREAFGNAGDWVFRLRVLAGEAA